MDAPITEQAEWLSSVLRSARLEHAALLRLLIEKKLIEPMEFLNELGKIAADDHAYSVQRFVAQSEWQLRDGPWHIGGAAATDRLGRRLALGPDALVLDAGCGLGGAARQIAESFGATVIGVDYRFERIVEAVLRTAALGLTSRVSYEVADNERLPFNDETFDAVVSQAAWNWAADKAAVVREAFRVLKPGGWVGLECEVLTEKVAVDEDKGPPGLFRLLAWQQLVGAAGFAEIEIDEMWEESRRFYPTGSEREQIDRGERVGVRMIARRPLDVNEG